MRWYIGVVIGGACIASLWHATTLWTTEAASRDTMTEPLDIREFIAQAVANDTTFEAILIDELALAYRKDLLLPARDIIASVKTNYDFILDQERSEPEATLALDKLFPYTGTSLNAEYKTTPSFSSHDNASEMDYSIAQSVARNAFGRATRLHDAIIGVEVAVATHQIIEAYEDYFAMLISAYYDWYEAYENVNISVSSYEENNKLLENMRERHNSKIALPIDVNKIHIQVLQKQETLIQSQERYDRVYNTVTTAIRYAGQKALVPIKPTLYSSVEPLLGNDFDAYQKASRTFQILALLEEKSTLDVKKYADDLLPSLELLIGYKRRGDSRDFKESDNMLYAGASLEFPFPDQVDRAEYAIAKIAADKTYLTTQSVYHDVRRDIENVALSIQKTHELLRLATEKVQLAESVLADESKNYTYGKVTLNDYIDAVNSLDNSRFNQTLQEVRLDRLRLEWLRLTDALVSPDDIKR